MTADPDVPIDELRRGIVEGLQRTLDKLGGGYAAPLRRQQHAEGDDYSAAVFCLGLGRLGGEESRTLPCALALALLEEMGRVFLGLEDGSTVTDAWGMPRTLNAADGLYALGRQILLTDKALDAEAKLEALSGYTDAARAFSEALHAREPEGVEALQKAARALYPAAASFAALCCGLDSDATTELAALAAETAEGAPGNLSVAFVKARAVLLRGA